MVALRNICRVLVGALFLFSGFVKIVDPIGTAIKLSKYHHIFIDKFGSFFKLFTGWELFQSVLLTSMEMVLGFALLILYRMRMTAWLLLILIIVFTGLTGYTAYTGQPSDCGCFGDFLKLTPMTSFIKDLILLAMILVIFIDRKEFKSAFSPKVGHILFAANTIFWVLFAKYNIDHLPVIDFRPYAIGNNLNEQMNNAENGISKSIMVYENKSNGEIKKFDNDAYIKSKIWEDTTWKWKETETEIIKPYKAASIQDMMQEDEETERILSGNHLIVVVRDIDLLQKDKNWKKLNDLLNELGGKNVEISFACTFNKYQTLLEDKLKLKQNGHHAIIMQEDESKAMIRSEVGYVLVADAVVKGKWHVNDTPTAKEVLSKLGI